MSIIRTTRVCIHCGKIYSYNPGIGGKICPYCNKEQSILSIIFNK